MKIQRISQATYFDNWNFVYFYCINLNLIFWCVYIPPTVSTNLAAAHKVASFIVSITDSTLISHPDAKVFICGDINQIDYTILTGPLNLVNTVLEPTRKMALLDVILISDSISSCDFKTSVGPPLGNSDHKIILFEPSNYKKKRNIIFRTVYDLRDANIDSFVSAISGEQWVSILEDEHIDIDSKCDYFHSILNRYIDLYIPSHTITCTDRDKPWITPIVKHLFNLRWSAYRAKNFLLYNHFKTKVKLEIQKSKIIWAQKNRKNAKQIWNSVNQILGKSSANCLTRLINDYPCATSAANAINSQLAKVFGSASSYDCNIIDDNSTSVLLLLLTTSGTCLSLLQLGKPTVVIKLQRLSINTLHLSSRLL